MHYILCTILKIPSNLIRDKSIDMFYEQLSKNEIGDDSEINNTITSSPKTSQKVDNKASYKIEKIEDEFISTEVKKTNRKAPENILLNLNQDEEKNTQNQKKKSSVCLII